jgi:hypothetical protein
MVATLIHLDEDWGGAAGYMSSIGMDPSSIGRLRSRLCQ